MLAAYHTSIIFLSMYTSACQQKIVLVASHFVPLPPPYFVEVIVDSEDPVIEYMRNVFVILLVSVVDENKAFPTVVAHPIVCNLNQEVGALVWITSWLCMICPKQVEYHSMMQCSLPSIIFDYTFSLYFTQPNFDINFFHNQTMHS